MSAPIPVVELLDLTEIEQLSAVLGTKGDVVEIRTTSGDTLTGTVTALLSADDRIRWVDLHEFERGPMRIRWSTVESVR